MSNASSTPESTQTQAASASTPTFLTALWLNAVVFGIELIAFTLLRKRFKSIYEPRTFLTPENKRVPSLADKVWGWPWAVFKADFQQINAQNGLDAYMFVRFLRMMVKILVPIWLVSWAVLLPVTSVGTSVSGRTGLDKFTFGNVSLTMQSRYAAHLVLAWLFTGYICYVLRGELREFVTTRQRHLVDPVHSASAQANTVLVTGVPLKFLNEAALTHLFSHVPGGVRKVWLNRDLKGLPDAYDRRLAACNKLESAENALLKTALKLHRKKGKIPMKDKDVQSPDTDVDTERRGSDLEEADRLVPRDKRPSHRLPLGFLPFSLPLIGKKVDTIEWARAEIVETNKTLDDERAVLESEIRDDKVNAHSSAELLTRKDLKYPALNSAFVLFNQQIGAHIAAQSLTHNEPFRMAQKYTEVAPADVVWGNLGLNPYEASVRTAISYLLTGGLIILWAFPVAFVGIISNVHGLCKMESWLAWLCTLPDIVVGIISGILPPVLLAVLFMLLPIILRLLARFEGIPTRSGIELSLMSRFFLFQVIHGFLIVTISSGIIAALPGLLKNPSGIPSMLAQKLPNASTFFLTYIILQGLAGTAGGFLTIVPLIIYYVKLFILGSTPRSIYSIKYTLRNVAWGTTFPIITLLAVITIAYSIISPIINALACATFFLFYFMYKYLFLWQLDMPPAHDTGGLFFPKAIQHVFVGLYIQQICLCALFFLAMNENGKPGAVAEGALMVVLIIITAFYNYILNSSYAPLLHPLPLSLADKSYGMPKNEPGVPKVVIGQEEDFSGEVNSHSEFTKSRQSKGASSSEDLPLSDVERSEQLRTDLEGADGVSHTEGQAQPGSSSINRKDGRGPADFAHPAAVEPQRIIWIAQDPLGLARSEARTLNSEGIETSSDHAVMDEKGHVEIDGHPPGEDPATTTA